MYKPANGSINGQRCCTCCQWCTDVHSAVSPMMKTLVLLAVAALAVPARGAFSKLLGEPVASLPLTRQGYGYAVSMVIGDRKGTVRPLLVDTGSAGLLLLPNDAYPFNSSRLISTTPSTTFIVDGERITFREVRSVRDYTAFPPPLSNVSASTTFAYASSVEQAATSPRGWSLHNWANTSGIFGVARNNIASVNTTFQELLARATPDGSRVYALQLDSSPRLHLGGVPSAFRDQLQWGEAMPDARTSHYRTPVFGLSVCGIDLLQPYSSSWFVLVDSGAACLTLPQPFFDAIMSWLPVSCESLKSYTACHVSSGIDIASLPSLTFRMSEAGSDLHLPLSSLVLPDRRLCIDRGAALDTESLTGVTDSPISFGSIVLRSFVTAFDDDTTRVAFANLPDSAPPSDDAQHSHCAARASCIGAQSLFLPLNRCVDPDCGSYYFQEVDPTTKLCRLTVPVQWLGAIAVLVFAALELSMYCSYERLVTSVHHPGSAAVGLTTLQFMLLRARGLLLCRRRRRRRSDSRD
eukprot:PLAT1678.1.p1 GENE.PLAT1678.1~~PLAT1678.1.p1  ORF type:complete len:522 (+),score=150.41 PLAT1678.1:3052-4617(+)